MKKEIIIKLTEKQIEEIKDYADGAGITVADFIELLTINYLNFQKNELQEVYLNDDGLAYFSFL